MTERAGDTPSLLQHSSAALSSYLDPPGSPRAPTISANRCSPISETDSERLPRPVAALISEGGPALCLVHSSVFVIRLRKSVLPTDLTLMKLHTLRSRMSHRAYSAVAELSGHDEQIPGSSPATAPISDFCRRCSFFCSLAHHLCSLFVCPFATLMFCILTFVCMFSSFLCFLRLT
jgi:hypothetical protein